MLILRLTWHTDQRARGPGGGKSTGFYGSLPSLRDLGVKGSFYLRAFRCAHITLRPRAALVPYGCTNGLLILWCSWSSKRSVIVLISIFLCYLPPLVDLLPWWCHRERKKPTLTHPHFWQLHLPQMFFFSFLFSF